MMTDTYGYGKSICAINPGYCHAKRRLKLIEYRQFLAMLERMNRAQTPREPRLPEAPDAPRPETQG